MRLSAISGCSIRQRRTPTDAPAISSLSIWKYDERSLSERANQEAVRPDQNGPRASSNSFAFSKRELAADHFGPRAGVQDAAVPAAASICWSLQLPVGFIYKQSKSTVL
jgi:hypothetical protein